MHRTYWERSQFELEERAYRYKLLQLPDLKSRSGRSGARQSASLVVDGYGCKSEFVFSQPKGRVGVLESRPSESYQGLLIKGLTFRSMPFCSYL
jgi:hypothetical protein